MVDLDVTWPDVFSQELDASYRPGISDIRRRGYAIADGLMAWGNCSLARAPDNFGLVIIKLAQEARISGFLSHHFQAAAQEWTKEWE